MNPHFAEDKYIFVDEDNLAFAYKYKRLEQNDFYTNLDYRHHQITIIVDTQEEAVTQFEIFDEGFFRLTEEEALQTLIIIDAYKRFSMCLN